VTSWENTVESTKKYIARELQAPSPVIQPLPSSESEALSVLFLLHMPNSVRALANLSFAAQQALLPRHLTLKEKNAMKTKRCDFDWIDHYASQQNKCVDLPTHSKQWRECELCSLLRSRII
jgi:hypothetical protein